MYMSYFFPIFIYLGMYFIYCQYIRAVLNLFCFVFCFSFVLRNAKSTRNYIVFTVTNKVEEPPTPPILTNQRQRKAGHSVAVLEKTFASGRLRSGGLSLDDSKPSAANTSVTSMHRRRRLCWLLMDETVTE